MKIVNEGHILFLRQKQQYREEKIMEQILLREKKQGEKLGYGQKHV